MTAFLLFNPAPASILMIGLGDGCLARFLLQHNDHGRIHAVELRPLVVEVATRYFGLERDARLQISTGCGALHVAHHSGQHPGCHDVIIVDAYRGEGMAPEVTSAQFFANCHALLADDGMLVINFCAYARYAGAERVVGLDASAEYIERARYRVPGAEFIHQSWDTLPVGPFDVILLASALHYASDQAALIASAMRLLGPAGTFVLELGVVAGDDPAWVEVARGSDTRLFPTWAKLREVLAPYTWKLVSESTLQKGDPTPRYVLHINARKPVAYLLMVPGGYGKTTLARELFVPAGVPIVSGDACLEAIAQGRVACDPSLQALVASNFKSTMIDDTMRNILAANLLPALVQVWLDRANGQTFALDASLAHTHHPFVMDFFHDQGYMAVRLHWERPGEKLLGIPVVNEMADGFMRHLQTPRTVDTVTPPMPFTGTLGAVTELRVNTYQFELRGWAVHENGRMPAMFEVRVGDSCTLVTAFQREVRLAIQSRLNLPHPLYGFRICLPLQQGMLPSQVRELLQVRGGDQADKLSPPFRTDPITRP